VNTCTNKSVGLELENILVGRVYSTISVAPCKLCTEKIDIPDVNFPLEIYPPCEYLY
jgi:hypothetical protein